MKETVTAEEQIEKSGARRSGPISAFQRFSFSAFPRKLLFAAAFCFLLSTFCFVFRAPLLRAAASFWIVNDPPKQADAIVLLGGGLETRPFAAAKLYRDGYAPRILIAQQKANPTDQMGLTPREPDVARQVLLKEGVPGSALTEIGHDVQNTYDESVAVRAWIGTNHVTRIIIPTDLFHTRRVRWLFRKQLRGTGVALSVQAVPVREYTQSDWWRHEQGVVAFQNEVAKDLYYHLKY